MAVRLPQLLLIFVQALAAHEGVHEGRAHRCIHDELHPRVAVRPQRYAELSDRDHEHHALADDRRALATDADDWQPLRIAVDYSSIDNATTLATIQDLVPYATSKLASALRVRPALAPLVVSGERCHEAAVPAAHGVDGVADADFVLYVTAGESKICTGAVLAYASTCVRDQFDRPVFGHAN